MENSLSTITYVFVFFLACKFVWVWSANHTFYFGYCRYKDSVDIGGCLAVAYLQR